MKWGVLTLFVLGLLLVPSVFGAGEIPPVGEIVQSVIKALQDIFQPILSVLLNYEAGGAFFGGRVLAGLVFFFILYVVVGKIPTFGDNKLIVFILSLVPTLLIMRYMTDEQFQGLLFPTTSLGTIIALAVPILGIFVALHYAGATSIVRRVVLAIVLIVYGVYYVSNFSQMPTELNFIYLLTFVVLLIMVLLDSALHKWFELQQVDSFKSAMKNIRAAKLQKQIQDLQSITPQTPQSKKAIKDLTKDLVDLLKN